MGVHMNPFDLLKNFNMEEMKKKADEIKEQMENITVTGEAGGGFVRVTMNGRFDILSIDYDNSDFIKDDISMFRDLIIAAHNDAVSKIREKINSELSGKLPFGGLGL